MSFKQLLRSNDKSFLFSLLGIEGSNFLDSRDQLIYVFSLGLITGTLPVWTLTRSISKLNLNL